MSINQDPAVFKLLIGCLSGFIIIVNTLALKIMASLKDTDRDLYRRINKIDTRLASVEATCKERHGIHD